MRRSTLRRVFSNCLKVRSSWASTNSVAKLPAVSYLTLNPWLQSLLPRPIARWVFPLCKALHNGKTHLAVALGVEALLRGQSVYFTSLSRLLQDLKRAYEENRFDKRLSIHIRPRLFIIDEVGYLPLDRLEATLLFQLISGRYEKGSIIITSNDSVY